jgi:pantoate--beta-alanine ligase
VRVYRTKTGLRAVLAPERRAGRSIGFVPTMGALHDGHLALIAAARERCDVVVLSVFVNPTQFGPGEDLDAYPRDERRDLDLAEGAGVDVAYAPSAEEVYPEDFSTFVEVTGDLARVLDGDPQRRGPAHFRGVTTVVAKLFNAVGPDVAFVGQKDAQQAVVIKRMVRDLDFPVEIVVVPTVREESGLALSSRNAYLDPAERERAAALSRALDLEARDAEDLSAAESFNGRPVLVAVAARVGRARLIDNVVIAGPAGTARDT